MFRSECFTKYKNGEYGYKNGVIIKREGKIWCVYYVTGKKAFTGDTLRECKGFLGRTMR